MRFFIIPVLLSLNVNAWAQETDQKPEGAEKKPMSETAFFTKYRTLFNKADKDFDGQLTQHEIRMFRFENRKDDYKNNFKTLDTNYDGYLSYLELKARHEDYTEQQVKQLEGHREKLLKLYDLNNDGSISSYEFDDAMTKKVQEFRDGVDASAQRDLKSKDKDNSGSVSLDEYIQSKAPKPNVRLTPTGPLPVLIPDQNIDGIITRTELESFLEEMFQNFDKNDDNELSPAEQNGLNLIKFL